MASGPNVHGSMDKLLQSMLQRITSLERRLVRAVSSLTITDTLRITSTADASPTSTNHPFQIGPTDAVNLVMDNNEIMGRNNGAVSGLTLNGEGGNVKIGDATSSISITGRIVGTHYPWAYSAGSFNVGTTISEGTFLDFTITFPSSRFTVAPNMTFGSTAVRASMGVQASSATGATIRVYNGTTGGSVGAASVIYWNAIQMTSTTANG